MKIFKWSLLILFLIGFYFFTRTLWFEGFIMNYWGPYIASNTGSMEPTIYGGDRYFVSSKTPKVGDIIAIQCSKPECRNYKGEIHTGGLIKRLIKVDDQGNWWVLGDNSTKSFDSRYFGWISPSERSDVGVVIPIR